MSAVHPRSSAVRFLPLLLAVQSLALSHELGAQETVPPSLTAADRAVLERILTEGTTRSQAMEHVVWLADVLGPRVTGSPAFEAAGEWVMERLQEWGMEEIRQERFAFGRGWSLERFSAHLVEPEIQPLVGMPKSWTPGTDGPVTAPVLYAPILSEQDFERYRGKLGGAIVLSQTAREVNLLEGRIVLRMGEEEIREAREIVKPAPASGGPAAAAASSPPSADRIRAFYQEEGVVAVMERGSDSDLAPGGSELSWTAQRTDGGTVFVGSGGSRAADADPGLPTVVLAVEHYNRMVRVVARDVPVRMELDVRVRFHDEHPDGNGFNVLAEIPGTDPAVAHEVVLLGAHLDSHHGATGATDNATGVAAMIEAMRILKAVDARPRRTIRVGLWGAEEQGLMGARDYVARHLMDGEEPGEEYPHLAAYYNLDNGTGRVRGIWLEENLAAGPVFRGWMELPELRRLGVDIVGPRTVGSTDHAAFTRVGLPGFQFIQERLEYRSRTHHSTMDTVDRVQQEDAEQQAVVAAIFAWLTSQREERIPRKR